MRYDDPNARSPSCGPAWDAAIEYGIDVSLLLANLELTPDERITQLHRQTELFELLRPKSDQPRAKHS